MSASAQPPLGNEQPDPAFNPEAQALVERNLLGRIAELERCLRTATSEKENLAGEVVALVNVMAHQTGAMNVALGGLQAIAQMEGAPTYEVARTIAFKACQDVMQAQSQITMIKTDEPG